MKKLIVLLGFMMVSGISGAQVNLKDKLNRKADQAVDELLFGKKKKEKDSATRSSEGINEDEDGVDDPSYAAESYDEEETNETASDPTGGYKRQPVDFSSVAPDAAVHFRQLIDFLPDVVGGFNLSGKPEGSTMKYEEASYSYGAKTYSNGEEELSIGLFDYLLTGELWGAYENTYEYESTEGLMKSVDIQGNPGWYSRDYESNESNLMLFVNNRFFLTLRQKNATDADFASYLEEMNLDSLPQGTPPQDPKD